MAELRLPHEGQRALDLVRDEFYDDVSRVDVDGADGHDFLAVALGQGAQEEGDQVVELGNLLLVVVLDGVLVALLQLAEGDPNLGRPPNLGSAQRDLSRVVKQPLVPASKL